jgi:hypothetical protein
MTNKYLEKAAGLAGVFKGVGNFAKAVPGVLRDAAGTDFKSLSKTQGRVQSLADKASAKANTFQNLANNTGGPINRQVTGASARSLNSDIAAHNANRAAKLQAHAASMQPNVDSAELKMSKARAKVGLGIGAVGVLGAGIASAKSSNNSDQNYY